MSRQVHGSLCTTKEGIATRSFKASKSEVEKLRNEVTKKDGFLNSIDCQKIKVVKFIRFFIRSQKDVLDGDRKP